MDDLDGCIACDLTHGRRPLPGGRLLTTGGWGVEHCVGPLGVGTLIVKPERHVVHVADLTAQESIELGPLLRRTAAAVNDVVRPEQVYVCLWSHAGRVPGHLHFVVQPATTADLDRYDSHGPGLQMAMFGSGELPPVGPVEEISERLRAALAA